MNRYIFRLEALFVFGVPVMLLVVAGLGFLVAALYMGLASGMAPTAAALITGAICLADAGLLSLIGWLVLRSLAPRNERNERGEKTPDAVQLAMAVGEALGGDLQSLAKNHRYGIVGAALAAGFAVGVSPKLRRSLLKLLGE